jgi:hypothetical protein
MLQGAIDAGRDAAGRLTASGSVKGAVPSVRALARALGFALPVPKDPDTLAGLSVSAGWSYREGAVHVGPLAAKLDSTTITGWVAYAPVNAWTFALRADHIDFSRYLTQPAKQQEPLALPQSKLRALHAQGTLELAHAQIDGTELQDVRLQVQ